MTMMRVCVLILCAALAALAAPAAAQTVSLTDLEPLADRLEALVQSNDPDGYVALLADDTDRTAALAFARSAFPDGVSRAVVVPRILTDDTPEDADREAFGLTMDVFTEGPTRARLQTWTVDVSPGGDPDLPRHERPWRITGQRVLGNLSQLHSLELDATRQFDGANLVIAGEDMTLTLRQGAVFVAEHPLGTTGLVLVGDGRLHFTPEPEAERGQVRIFAGDDELDLEFTHAFIRLNPEMYTSRVSTATLTEVPVDADRLEEATQLFDEVSTLAYAVDMSEFSDRPWWVNPGVGDFLAEIRTRRHGQLTYVQAQNSPEDVTLYQREPLYRVIALYPSARKQAVQGRYFDDGDRLAYDVLDYDIIASFDPAAATQQSMRSRRELQGCWIDATARLAVRVTGLNLRTLTLRLAEDLDVRSITSRELGPLPFFRMRGQDSVVITLPRDAPIGTEFTLTVSYGGLLPPQELEENWIGRARHVFDAEAPFGIGEDRYIYSSSSYWYPQSTVSDYATATMALSVPAGYGVVASGDPVESNPPIGSAEGETGTRRYQYVTLQPARYLSAVISSFWPHGTERREVRLADDARGDRAVRRPGVRYDQLALGVETNPRTRERMAETVDRSEDILRFYGELIGDIPYPAFTVAMTDATLPGGHSPAYFAILNQPLPLSPGTFWSWRTDPVAFSDIEFFFLAHEIAHQWWGQAVGWKNYHEQWLSEALSHYFAALYVEHALGEEAFVEVLSEMRRWSLRHSSEGPVYLGYRLGLIEDEPRIYRALVYNKGALVLHMLRRLIGDEDFFGGLRRYYDEMRFERAGTDDLIRAFETQAARSLEAFFERWIHEDDVPTLRFDSRTETREGQSALALRFEQTDKIFEVPVTVTLRYRSGAEETTVVPVTEAVTEVSVPLTGALRDVEVNADHAALAEIEE